MGPTLDLEATPGSAADEKTQEHHPNSFSQQDLCGHSPDLHAVLCSRHIEASNTLLTSQDIPHRDVSATEGGLRV